MRKGDRARLKSHLGDTLGKLLEGDGPIVIVVPLSVCARNFGQIIGRTRSARGWDHTARLRWKKWLGPCNLGLSIIYVLQPERLECVYGLRCHVQWRGHVDAGQTLGILEGEPDVGDTPLPFDYASNALKRVPLVYPSRNRNSNHSKRRVLAARNLAVAVAAHAAHDRAGWRAGIGSTGGLEKSDPIVIAFDGCLSFPNDLGIRVATVSGFIVVAGAWRGGVWKCDKT